MNWWNVGMAGCEYGLHHAAYPARRAAELVNRAVTFSCALAVLLHYYKTDSVLAPICQECCYQGWAKRLDSILHFVSYHILCGNTHIVHLPVLEPRHFVPQQLPKPEESRCSWTASWTVTKYGQKLHGHFWWSISFCGCVYM